MDRHFDNVGMKLTTQPSEQLWHVNEILTLRAGPSLFPTGCAIDLYAKTSVMSSVPTLNVGAADGTNLAVVVVNQPL